MGRVIAIVGLCGAGKSIVADSLVDKGCGYVRFGQITLDEVKKRGLQPNEKLEREIREGFRKEYGMAAFAILNLPKLEQYLLQGKDVVADGLYSWDEFKVLKEKFGDNFSMIAVYASPKTRYARICNRDVADDTQMRFRSFTPQEALSRDYAEIEHSAKGGPIAYADYTIMNEGSLEETKKQIEKIWSELHG